MNERQNHVCTPQRRLRFRHTEPMSPAAPSSPSMKPLPDRRSQSEIGITRETTSGRNSFIPKNTCAISRSFITLQRHQPHLTRESEMPSPVAAADFSVPEGELWRQSQAPIETRKAQASALTNDESNAPVEIAQATPPKPEAPRSRASTTGPGAHRAAEDEWKFRRDRPDGSGVSRRCDHGAQTPPLLNTDDAGTKHESRCPVA